jgi:hypothetical protein
MPDWWDNLLAPDTRSLEQRRGSQISERMDALQGRQPLFVAGDNDSVGGSAEENAAYQDARADATQQSLGREKQQLAEDARLFEEDKQDANPRNWDGAVAPDGTVLFRDAIARQGDTPRAKMLREQLTMQRLLGKAPSNK